MAKIKLTKAELKTQKFRLNQLNRYLPTLQLKKAMLQAKVQEIHQEVVFLTKEYNRRKEASKHYATLLGENTSLDFQEAVKVIKVNKRLENIAGIEIPVLEDIQLEQKECDLFETPAWTDVVINELKNLAESKIKLQNELEKQKALDKELEDVTVKVNLFEKRLIPQTKLSLKKIKIFLGDQELSAIARTKMAKTKLQLRALSRGA